MVHSPHCPIVSHMKTGCVFISNSIYSSRHTLYQLNFLKGECAPGWLSCGSGSNFTCVEDNGEHWKVIEPYRLQISPTDWILINLLNDKDLPTQCEVDAPCQPLSTPCHSSCPHGHLLVDDDHCVLQENLCPEAEQCVHDEDCQDNAGCLLSGTVRYIHFVKKCPQVMATLYLSLPSVTWSSLRSNQVMACQCYLNFVATPSNETCPRTGVCTNALDVAQVTRSGVLILIVLAKSLRFEKDNFASRLFSSFREANYHPVMSRET